MNEMTIRLSDKEYEELQEACQIMQGDDLPEYVRTTLRKAVEYAKDFGEIEMAVKRLDAESAEEGGNEGCATEDDWQYKKTDEPLKPFATFYPLKKALDTELGMTGIVKGNGCTTYYSPTGMPLLELYLSTFRDGWGINTWGLGGCGLADEPDFQELRRRVHAHSK